MLRRMAMKEWVWGCGAPGEGGLVLLTTEAAVAFQPVWS